MHRVRLQFLCIPFSFYTDPHWLGLLSPETLKSSGPSAVCFLVTKHDTGIFPSGSIPSLELALVDEGSLIARGCLARFEEGVVWHESVLGADGSVLLARDVRGSCHVDRIKTR